MPVPANHTPGAVITAADVNALAALANAAQPGSADLTTIAGLSSGTAGALVTDGSGWIRKTYAQLKTALGLVKADVGLGNVDNTADTAKPVSAAQQTALDLKAPLASPAFTGTPTKGGSPVLSQADAAGAYLPVAPAWVTGRAYVLNELVINSGTLYRVSTAHTSGGAFDATKFTAVSGLDTTAGDARYGPARPIVSGNWYKTEPVSVSTRTLSLNNLFLTPMVLAPCSIDQLAINVTTAGAAGDLARLGLYSAAASGLPTTLVEDLGTVAIDTTGVKTATLSVARAVSGLFWLGVVGQSITGSPVISGNNNGSPYVASGTASTVLTTTLAAYTKSAVSGALPTPLTSLVVTSNGPLVAVRIV